MENNHAYVRLALYFAFKSFLCILSNIYLIMLSLLQMANKFNI